MEPAANGETRVADTRWNEFGGSQTLSLKPLQHVVTYRTTRRCAGILEAEETVLTAFAMVALSLSFAGPIPSEVRNRAELRIVGLGYQHQLRGELIDSCLPRSSLRIQSYQRLDQKGF